MLNSVERISLIIPKFKHQLIFLEEREKLFKQPDDYLLQNNNSFASTSNNSQSSAAEFINFQPSAAESINSQSLTISSLNIQSSPTATALTDRPSSKEALKDSASDHSESITDMNTHFPDDYKIPSLPHALVKDIENGNLSKFGPHCANRQVLIDAISYDLMDQYNLFYPTHKQFDDIGAAIVKYLKLPITKQNVTIWKDALQTKLKRKRLEYRNNTIVQEHVEKFSRAGSGRPVKRKLGETAARDRYKQVILIPNNDDTSNDIQLKTDQLRDLSTIDIHTQLCLWKETLYLRRESIRDRSTIDILKDFPGYKSSFLIFEEVKMLVKIDLSAAVRKQTPALLDKLADTPIFIADSPPIRLIKILCRHFDETIQHIFCDIEPPTPYPTLVCIDDLIHVYVDFNLIVSTNSPDDAVALLIAMYTIFELTFDKKSRTIRFLYSLLHGEKRFLSNSIRLLMKEKNIDIQCEHHRISSPSLHSEAAALPIASTTARNEPQKSTEVQMNSMSNVTLQSRLSITGQPTKTISSNSNFHAEEHSINTSSSNIENAASADLVVEQRKQPQRKRKRNNLGLDDENNTHINVVKQNDDQASDRLRSPLANIINSNNISRIKKRRRRS